MVALRKRKLTNGFETHADYVLDNTMAKTTLNVNKLLDTVWNPGIEKASEAEAMQEIILEEGGNFKLEAWDVVLFRKTKTRKFDFKEEEVKPYFSEDKV